MSNSYHPSCELWWDPRIAWFSPRLRWILEHINLRSSRIHGCIFLQGTCWRSICGWLVWSDRLEYHDTTCHSLFNLLCLLTCIIAKRTNVGKYTIHGCYGMLWQAAWPAYTLPKNEYVPCSWRRKVSTGFWKLKEAVCMDRPPSWHYFF